MRFFLYSLALALAAPAAASTFASDAEAMKEHPSLRANQAAQYLRVQLIRLLNEEGPMTNTEAATRLGLPVETVAPALALLAHENAAVQETTDANGVPMYRCVGIPQQR